MHRLVPKYRNRMHSVSRAEIKEFLVVLLHVEYVHLYAGAYTGLLSPTPCQDPGRRNHVAVMWSCRLRWHGESRQRGREVDASS